VLAPRNTTPTTRGGTLREEATVRDHAHLIHPFDPEFDEVGEVELTDLIADLITGLGEDVTREGLLKTPDRVERSLRFLTSGYHRRRRRSSTAPCSRPRARRWWWSRASSSTRCASTTCCRSSARPTSPTSPARQDPGAVEVRARRRRVRAPHAGPGAHDLQIADALEVALEPLGLAVVTEASHLCMMMRGVEKQGSSTRTSAMRGVFKSDARTRQEFLEAIRGA
jgi:GTP cyclohydrolase IA